MNPALYPLHSTPPGMKRNAWRMTARKPVKNNFCDFFRTPIEAEDVIQLCCCAILLKRR